MLSPLPKRRIPVGGLKRKRTSLGATVLTSSPYKNDLVQKLSDKESVENSKNETKKARLLKAETKRKKQPMKGPHKIVRKKISGCKNVKSGSSKVNSEESSSTIRINKNVTAAKSQSVVWFALKLSMKTGCSVKRA